ncbi:MAG: oxidoreductase [Myxococcales bacterium]|nr:oxidoreductase [Myxococcales bacterium]
MLLVTSAIGCEQASSKLDGMKAEMPSAENSAAVAVSTKADHSGDVETRLRRLEDHNAKYAEALDFLGKVYGQQKQQQQQQAAEEHDPNAMFAVQVAEDIKFGKVDGPASAPVTVVKAFDFACPYCERTSGIMDELVKEYGGKVRVVYKDMVVHPQVATAAHMAACAGAKQGKYKEMKNAIWAKGFLAYSQSRDPSKMGEENLKAIAKEVGLDMAKLEADMKGAECQAMVQGDMAELNKFKVTGTPGFFINGKFIGGALPKEGFKQIIDEQLKIAEASGVSGADYYEKVVLAKGEKQFKSAAGGGAKAGGAPGHEGHGH